MTCERPYTGRAKEVYLSYTCLAKEQQARIGSRTGPGGNTEDEGLRDTNRIMQSKTSLAMDSLLYANKACMSSTDRLHGLATEKHGPNNNCGKWTHWQRRPRSPIHIRRG